MHELGTQQRFDPFPPNTFEGDAEHRHAANRALLCSQPLGLTLTGGIEFAIALVSGSVGTARRRHPQPGRRLHLAGGLHRLPSLASEASASHPYGYERAEDLAGLGVALVIWASAVFAGYVSIHKLAHHGTTSHLGLGVAAAAVGIVGNQIVARYKLRVGTRIQSNTLVADAKHSWLDAIASAGALLGLVGVACGLWWADGVAGLLVTGFIVHVGWEVTSDVRQPPDGQRGSRILAGAESAALAVPGVDHVHVRARWLGRTLLVEVEGFIAGSVLLDDTEATGSAVRQAISAAVPEVRAVVWSPHALPTP